MAFSVREAAAVQALTGRSPKRRRVLERAAPWLFVAPALAYLCLFFGYPLVKNVVMSFQDYTTSTFFTGVAPWAGFSNYTSVFKDPVFKTTLINTLLFTVGSIAGQFVIGMGLALFFKRK